MVIFQNGFSPKAASQQPRVVGDPRLLTIVIEIFCIEIFLLNTYSNFLMSKFPDSQLFKFSDFQILKFSHFQISKN